MPNWCYNRLCITGKEEELERLLSLVGENLDFERVIPYPRRFRVMDEKYGEMQRRLALFSFLKKGDPDNPRLAERVRKIQEWLRNHRDGYNSGGYEWCVENWGTKWPAEEVDLEKEGNQLVFTFSTAWNPPVPVVVALARRFRGLEFRMYYEEPGNDFVGEITLKGGKVVESWEESYADHILKEELGEDLYSRLSKKQKEKLSSEIGAVVLLKSGNLKVVYSPVELYRTIVSNWGRIEKIRVTGESGIPKVTDLEEMVYLWKASESPTDFRARALAHLL
ncbi:MAG: hypothetical protein QW356_02060 [Candidatus Hadarchaeales archaeon]